MKKQFKRTIAMFSAACLTLAVCLSGCGNSSNPAPSGDGSGDGGSSGQVIEASLAHVMAVGSPADLGANRFAELRPGFVKAQDLINEIAQALDSTAQALEETDSNIAGSFRG